MKDLLGKAVLITQIIKTNLEAKPQEIIQLILKEVPELTPNQIIWLLSSLGTSLGYQYKDLEDLIYQWQIQGLEAVTDIAHNTLWQNIGQGAYIVLNLLNGLPVPPWLQVVTGVISKFYELFKKDK